MAPSKERSKRAREVLRRLGELYPGTAQELCALRHDNPFQLLVATILSAQCTDVRVNMVVPALFKRYKTPRQLAAADVAELEELIRSTGFFRSKAQNLIGMAQGLVAEYNGEVPASMEELVRLPGVGRKTANVILSVAFAAPGLPVDTHVLRLSKLLGLATSSDPVKVEAELCSMLEPSDWGAMSLRLILHGRSVCIARRPHCESCVLASICPSAGKQLPIAKPRKAREAKVR